MSTIKSSAENLTLNADGANNDIKFQSNGSEVAAIDQAGNLTVSGTVYTAVAGGGGSKAGCDSTQSTSGAPGGSGGDSQVRYEW